MSRPCVKITCSTKGVQKLVWNVYNNLLKEAEEDVSRLEIMKRTARLLNASLNTVKRIIRKWGNNETISPDKKKGKMKPGTDVDGFSREAIAQIVYMHLRQGRTVTVKELFNEIANDDNIYFHGSTSSLRRVLKELGFVRGKGDASAHVRESLEILDKRLDFLRAYMRNKERENPKLVVFLDETWIFVNGKQTQSWMDPTTSKGIIQRPEEGGRIVILHAGSKNGFVPDAGLIFQTNLEKGKDYHRAMNAEKFEDWTRNKLIPALREMGPCLIVMDNASYHSRLLEQSTTTKWMRRDLIDYCQEKGVLVADNATASDLWRITKSHRYLMKRYVVDEMFRNEGHQVLRTPPYHCIFNAIDNVWSQTKDYYNKHVASRQGHGFERSNLVWQEALLQVTAEQWTSYVNLTEKVINDYYEKEVKIVPDDGDEIVDIEDSDSDIEDTDSEDNEKEATILPLPGPSTSRTHF